MGGVGVAFDGINGDEVNLELNLNEPRLEAPEGLSAPAVQGRPQYYTVITGLFSPIPPVYLVWSVLGKMDYGDVDGMRFCSPQKAAESAWTAVYELLDFSAYGLGSRPSTLLNTRYTLAV
ncbi:hypothetical protein N7481_005725 [Penicillium waksmanii]|uniref:uncharacterized protein n=1 Tax=Penicillium waksmanii TaxID=69791 RepID=UPI002546BEE5|nr:uncharacterized protein N7481_005725 [Penicillium waksmanii]KAJ5983626.1 hypothetical protein N7481_005725 [Penicillium waksmanii]